MAIYVATERLDLRRSFDGLSGVVREVLREDPLSGALFMFFNKAADRVKILWWDRTGYASSTSASSAGRFACRRGSSPARRASQVLEANPRADRRSSAARREHLEPRFEHAASVLTSGAARSWGPSDPGLRRLAFGGHVHSEGASKARRPSTWLHRYAWTVWSSRDVVTSSRRPSGEHRDARTHQRGCHPRSGAAQNHAFSPASGELRLPRALPRRTRHAAASRRKVTQQPRWPP
ncbi:IS66 family insertion sequence element accessory protein TnpB [Polyangium fumosum]